MKYWLFILAFFPLSLFAQVDFAKAEKEIDCLSHYLLTDTLAENRQVMADSIQALLTRTLSQEGAFNYPFDSLPAISIQTPEDQAFRIFTWQLYVDVDEYRYFGLIQLPGKQPSVITLKDQSENLEEEDLNYEILDKDNWYGSLYYNIKSYKTKKGMRYLLFGFDGFRFFQKRKLVDVLYFENGEPVFGEPTFFPDEEDRPDLAYSRMVLSYGAASSIRLNYDTQLDIIIFDNLIVGEGGNLERGDAILPDGSYRGYKLHKGRWIHQEKIFDHVWESAPRPQPILNGRRNTPDIFGKTKKQ